MPTVSVYIPDALYAEAKRLNLSLSRVAQDALAEAVAAGENASWIAEARRRPTRPSTLSTEAVTAGIHEEFGA